MGISLHEDLEAAKAELVREQARALRLRNDERQRRGTGADEETKLLAQLAAIAAGEITDPAEILRLVALGRREEAKLQQHSEMIRSRSSKLFSALIKIEEKVAATF